MAHTFANLLTPVIFSTKYRRPLLTPHLRTDLLAYLGGIVRNIHGKLMDSTPGPTMFTPRLPEGASDPLRRAVYLGVASAAPAGAAHAADALAPTAHAVGYFLSALRA